MKVWTYSIIRNEIAMLPWFVRHYSSWVDRMIFYDDKSDDGSREFLQKQPKCDVREWPHDTGLDDEKFIELFNSVSTEAAGSADWVATVDADELLYAPNMLALLERASGHMIPVTGYALINPQGWPKDDGVSQIYDLVKVGARQDNYDKRILFRPTAHPRFAHGRHYYPGQWPKYAGTETPDYGVRLLHLHHIGGISDTIMRNQRDYDRAHNKKYAWNYAPEHNFNANQVGSVAWVERLIATKQLVDVVGERPIKLNLGCGSNRLPGWRNHDADMDLRKPLPFKDGTVSHILAEHCVEHITPAEAWRFFEEAKRVLMPGGVLRVAIPDIERMASRMTPEYMAAVQKGGFGDGSARDAIKAAVVCHGHQAVWTSDLLSLVLCRVGFNKTRAAEYGQSIDPALCNVEGHGKVVGKAIAEVETSIVEGVK